MKERETPGPCMARCVSVREILCSTCGDNDGENDRGAHVRAQTLEEGCEIMEQGGTGVVGSTIT